MAIKDVTVTINGSIYVLALDGTTGKYIKEITAPAITSWNQTDHVYAMVLNVTDMAGNVTTVDKDNTTYGEQMKLRVKERIAPFITVSSPGSEAYLTSNIVSFSIDIIDTGSGVAESTIAAELDGTTLELTKVAITNGYRCTYSGIVEDGKYTLIVNASDNDGNAATETVSFTVDTVPPMLDISEPSANLITNKQVCTVSGTTNDVTSGLAAVTITLNGAGQGDVIVSSDGTFSKSVLLTRGDNEIVIEAIDKAGKSTIITRAVSYDPDAPVIISVDVSPNPVDAGSIFTITVEATD